MIEFIIIGSILGIIAGLIPGIHTNNIALIIVATNLFGDELTTIILTLAIVQTFVEFIPTTFLGVPTTQTYEGVLPAHKLVLEGKAHEAIILLTYGGLLGAIASIILTPLFIAFVNLNKNEIILITPIILAFSIILMIISEETKIKQIIAIFVIIAATTQGMLFLDQLFPLISGYFGLSNLLYSIKEENKETPQIQINKIEEKGVIIPILGSIAGAIVALMPGIGTNIAARIIKTFIDKINEKEYLKMIGAINISNFFFGYVTLFVLNKSRNGAMIAIENIINLTENQLIEGILIMVLSSAIGAIIVLTLSKYATRLLKVKIVKPLTILSIITIVALVLLFNGIIGIICLIFATALGLITITTKVKRSLCMSALIVPTLFFYLFILI